MKRISFVVAILLGLAVANTEVPKAPVVSAPIAQPITALADQAKPEATKSAPVQPTTVLAAKPEAAAPATPQPATQLTEVKTEATAESKVEEDDEVLDADSDSAADSDDEAEFGADSDSDIESEEDNDLEQESDDEVAEADDDLDQEKEEEEVEQLGQLESNENNEQVEEAEEDDEKEDADEHEEEGNDNQEEVQLDFIDQDGHAPDVDAANDWKVPKNHLEDKDDIFMRSVYRKYATKSGNKWVMTKAATLALSKEVLATHKGLKGPELDLWIGDHFDSTWEYYDAAHQGSLAPDRMPSFMRYLANDRKLAIFAQTDAQQE